MTPNSDFTNDLLKKIQQTKPRDKSYFLFRNFIFGFLILVLICLSVYLLSAFWIDAYQISDFLIDEKNIGWNFLQEALFEFVLFAIIFVGLIYIIYRQTDWFLVRHKIILIASFFCIILLGSFLTVLIFDNQQAPKQAISPIQNLPYRPQRKEIIQQKLQEKDIFVGKLISVNFESKQIIIKNPREEKTFFVPNNFNLSDLLRQIRTDQDLAVKYEIQKEKFVVQKIKILPKRPIRN
jgi:hypothetical protein